MITSRNSSVWEGAPAPDFLLTDESGANVTLKSFLDRGPLMLAFYPVDFGIVCTKQLCGYQDALGSFLKYGVQVAAVSFNPPASHLEFKRKYHFSFPLLSDPGKSTFRSYGVTSLFMLGGTSRAVFIIGKTGKVLYRYVEPTIATHRKAGELIEILDTLRAKGQI